MPRLGVLPSIAAVAAAIALAGCGRADTSSSLAANVAATVSLSQVSAPAFASAGSNLLFDVMGGRISPAAIDSLLVTVTRVDVLPDSVLAVCHPPLGDSVAGFRPGRPGEGPDRDDMGRPRNPLACGRGPGGGELLGPDFGRPFPPGHGMDHPRPDEPRTHADSILPPDSGWGSRPNQWYSLDVVGSGRLDLVHLPSDSAHGLTLAAGSVPAGDYGAAHLIVSDATIWFNTTITTADSVTLQPNTAYPVLLPRRRAAQGGIMTSAGFTVPSGGGNVVLIFDASQMLAGAVVTDSGRVVLGPMLRPRRD